MTSIYSWVAVYLVVLMLPALYRVQSLQDAGMMLYSRCGALLLPCDLHLPNRQLSAQYRCRLNELEFPWEQHNQHHGEGALSEG